MGQITSSWAFRETKFPAKAGECCWTLMVKLSGISKSSLYYEQFAKGKYTVYFNDGSTLERDAKDVTLRNKKRKFYPPWYEDMQAKEDSGPKMIVDGDERVRCTKIGKNEIFYQWWDWPGVNLNLMDEYKDYNVNPPKLIGYFVGIKYDLEFSHKLWESDPQIFSLSPYPSPHPTHKNNLITFFIALTGENMLDTPARDTRYARIKSREYF